VVTAQSISQSMGFVNCPLQNWTAMLDRSTVIKYSLSLRFNGHFPGEEPGLASPAS